VDGRFRGVIVRDSAGVRSHSAETLVKLMSHKDLAIRLAAVKAAGKLKIEQASDPLFARLKGDNEAGVRSEALKAMVRINSPKIGEAIKVALADKDKAVRVTGLDLLENLSIPKELMVSLLADVIKTKTPEEKQAALVTLGKLPLQNTQPVLDQLLTTYASGKLPAEVQLEFAEAIDSTHSAPLISRYKTITAGLSTDTLKAAYDGALLGGDTNRGERIFFSHQTAQCLRCHSFDDMGGTAGPRLNGVASRLTRPQILEALINPSARLAPGFGTVTLELKNGEKVNGILQGENDKEITVKVGDKPDAQIRKDQIAKRTDGASSMPPMRLLLTKKEIRDVVSFLSTLK
jgi:putative heme-binding domain-containing protein